MELVRKSYWVLAALTIGMYGVSPSRGQGWPIGNGTTHQPVYSTYGQYYEFGGGLHFHEGLDMITGGGTPVIARGAGTVLGVNNIAGSGAFMVAQIGGTGFNFVHMSIGNRPAGNNGAGDLGGAWMAGDTINLNDQLGAVAAQPGGSPHPNHLHVDSGGGANDPFFFTGGVSPQFDVIRLPTADPLSGYIPTAAANNPVPVMDPSLFQFRIASHDRNGVLTPPAAGAAGPTEALRQDNLYFQEKIDDGLLKFPVIGARPKTKAANGTEGVGSANIDILAMAFDQATVGGTRNTPKQMDLKIFGLTFGANTGLNTVYNFSGQFLSPHGYTQMRDPTAQWLRTVYSNDATTDSQDVSDPGANPGTYWFQMTNYDGDQLVETTDRARFWNSDVEAGSDFFDTAATDAFRNEDGAFMDDFYDINIIARDIAGNFASSVLTVILDNWEQTIELGKAVYGTNETIQLVGGEQYGSNDFIDLYLLNAMPTEGQLLSDPFTTVATEGAGDFALGPLGSVGMLGSFFLVADYDTDGRYYSPLDAITNFSVVPVPTALVAGAVLLCGLWLVRRVRATNPSATG